MTNIDDLHNEAHILPIKEHTHMLARPLPHRPQMKPDLFNKYENQLPNRRIEEKEAKRLQKAFTHRPSTKSAAVSD